MKSTSAKSIFSSMVKALLQWNRLTEGQRNKCRTLGRILRQAALYFGGVFRFKLDFLARMAGTDKFGVHTYTPIYTKYLSKLRNRRINLLEIGVGGYDKSAGGASLRMWQAYFQFGQIVGLDIYDKSFLSKGRIKVYQGAQADREVLGRLIDKYPSFDVIIDDGSHVNAHQMASFEILFPHLKPGGIYVIEDVQTSYWPKFGGGDVSTDAYTNSTMHFFKQLADGLNFSEHLIEDYEPTYYDKNILSLSFFHNLIIIEKGDNTETSNRIGTRHQV